MSNLLPRAERFVFDKLLAASVAGSRIYSGVAPANAAEPYVVMQLQSPGTDEQTLNQNRVWAEPLFLVKAVARTRSWSTLQAVADAIDTALHHTAGSVSGGLVINAYRERHFSLIEQQDGEQVRHLGSFVRVRVQEGP